MLKSVQDLTFLMQFECWENIKVIQAWNTGELQRKSCDIFMGLRTTCLHIGSLTTWM